MTYLDLLRRAETTIVPRSSREADAACEMVSEYERNERDEETPPYTPLARADVPRRTGSRYEENELDEERSAAEGVLSSHSFLSCPVSSATLVADGWATCPCGRRYYGAAGQPNRCEPCRLEAAGEPILWCYLAPAHTRKNGGKCWCCGSRAWRKTADGRVLCGVCDPSERRPRFSLDGLFGRRQDDERRRAT